VLYYLPMTDPDHATASSTASATSAASTAIATADNVPERLPYRAADDWLALPWPVADEDERRRLRREMVLRALI
jgi:hypothetical protein